MASQNTKGELKLSKRTFAPPVAKSNTLLAKGEPELLSKQEDAQPKEIPLSQATGDGVETKITKARVPKVNTKAQNKRWKGSSRIQKEVKHGKDPDMSKNEEGCLTDAQFEEIVQSVLQKSLQECLEYSGKRLVLAESTVEASLGRETLEPSPTAGNAVPGKASQDKAEAMFLEAKQKKHLARAKEDTELPVNKNRKEKNEKPEADNGGRKENRKGVPKKKVQGNTRITVGREEMQEEEEADRGSGCSWCMAWVQCSYPTCEKWRRLSNDIDPSVLPKDWSCSQNPGKTKNGRVEQASFFCFRGCQAFCGLN
ncbi:hypothetical protein lerEdw1_006363 [Lerista edwardsae]|nr:hypothetical protein lerEdw1_006363 [Lerista edwardsae]